MVEVLSPRRQDVQRDRVDKLAEYARFGVRYYWIVDPARRTLEIFELTAGDRYALALASAEGRVDTVPGCEDLAIDLDALWAEVDALENP